MPPAAPLPDLAAGDSAGDSTARAPRGGRGVLAAVGVAAVLATFLAPAILGQGDFVARDTGRLHAPMKRWIRDELGQGRLPQWNPYAGLGTPVVGNALDAVQHPFTAAIALLPPAAGLRAWVLLSFALAAAGGLLWARALGLGAPGGAVLALAFALSGPLVSSTDNVTYLTAYATLPLVLAAAHVHAARGGPLPLLGAGAAAALCAAAGDPQSWAVAVALLPAYAVAAAPAGARRLALRRGLGAAAAAAVLSAPFVLPILAWLPHSARAAGVAGVDRGAWNLHPRRLLELVVPELLRDDAAGVVGSTGIFRVYAGDELPWFLSVYVGAALVALAAAGAWARPRARLLVAGAAVLAWAALGPHAGFGALAARLPVLQAFRYWEKLAVWIPLLLAPAAADGAEALARGAGTRGVARAAGAGAALLLAVAALAGLAPGAVAAWAGGPDAAAARLAANLAAGAAHAGAVLALLAGVAALIGRGRLVRAAPVAVLAVVALDLFGGNAGAYVLGPPERTTTPPLAAALPPGARVLTPFRARDDRWPELGRLAGGWEWSRRTLGPSWNVPLRVATPLDYVGLRDARWAAILAAVSAAQRPDRLGLLGFSHLVVPGAPENALRFGVVPPLRVVGADPELPAFVVEVPHRARAHLAPGPFRATAAEALAFAEAGGADGRTAVEGPVPPATSSDGEAEVVADAPGETRVRARAGGPALLVLSDLDAPGWTATVDGRAAPIVRTNGAVRGVWLEPGSHEVRFRYRTPGLAVGWGIALAGVAAIGAWVLFARMGGRGRATTGA